MQVPSTQLSIGIQLYVFFSPFSLELLVILPFVLGHLSLILGKLLSITNQYLLPTPSVYGSFKSLTPYAVPPPPHFCILIIPTCWFILLHPAQNDTSHSTRIRTCETSTTQFLRLDIRTLRIHVRTWKELSITRQGICILQVTIHRLRNVKLSKSSFISHRSSLALPVDSKGFPSLGHLI